MFTFHLLANALIEAGRLEFAGTHYRDEVPVYSGNLWRLFPGDTNHKKKNRFEALAEKAGAQVRFDDEIVTDDNGKVHERIPGYHGQIATWQLIDDSIWSQDEAVTHTGAYLEALLDLPANQRATRWLTPEQLEEQGFIRFDYDAESGFHPGQTDRPETVIAKLQEEHPGDWETVFMIDDVGQFDCHFSIWYRAKEED